MEVEALLPKGVLEVCEDDVARDCLGIVLLATRRDAVESIANKERLYCEQLLGSGLFLFRGCCIRGYAMLLCRVLLNECGQ